jgi:hypothetical protein
MQEARGRGEKFNPRQLHEKIQVIGPAINLDKLTRSIDVEILDRLGIGWDRMFGLLQKFHKREGHCRVAELFVVKGEKLGVWVSVQRLRKHQLTQDRIKRLNSLGFSWDPHSEQWEKGYALLKEFHAREGHCRVMGTLIVDGLNLTQWVRNKRFFKDRLTTEQIKRLDSLDFIWNPQTEQWDEAFAALQKFKIREGHCRAPKGFKEDGVSLGRWVNKQRTQKDQLSAKQIGRLNSIGFTWSMHIEQWEETFKELVKFQMNSGHCHVPYKVKVGGMGLGTWVVLQRQKRDKLSKDQIKRLDLLGFSWNTRIDQWDEAFEALHKFKNREGHCRVPRGYKDAGVALASWVTTQRRIKNKLSHDRIKRLESVGFCWDPFIEQWEKAFAMLKEYFAREGHHRVPQKLVVDGIRLGSWVNTQRQNKNSLSGERILRLNSAGFIWKT